MDANQASILKAKNLQALQQNIYLFKINKMVSSMSPFWTTGLSGNPSGFRRQREPPVVLTFNNFLGLIFAIFLLSMIF
jgi:hypothetical protein